MHMCGLSVHIQNGLDSPRPSFWTRLQMYVVLEVIRSSKSGQTVSARSGQRVSHVTGKSSFLAAILGELRGTCGRVKIQGSLAYVPQQPWVMSGTLRDNILFKKQVRHAMRV